MLLAKQEINYPSIEGIPYRSLPLCLYDGLSKPLADSPSLNAEWCELGRTILPLRGACCVDV